MDEPSLRGGHRELRVHHEGVTGNFCLQTPTIRRHVQSEIARLERKGERHELLLKP